MAGGRVHPISASAGIPILSVDPSAASDVCRRECRFSGAVDSATLGGRS
jgi:hypothetical protein